MTAPDYSLTVSGRATGPAAGRLGHTLAAYARARSAGIESLSADERAALEACSRSPEDMRRVLDLLEDE